MKLAFNSYRASTSASKNILFLHGLLGMGDNFRAIAKALTLHANAFTVDLRNHGNSPHSPSHSVKLMCQDVKRLIEQEGLSDLTVVGHSMGGKVVRQMGVQCADLRQKIHNLVIVDIANQFPREDLNFSFTYGLLKFLAGLSLEGSRQSILGALAAFTDNSAVLGLLSKNLIEIQGKFKWRFNIPTLLQAYPEFIQHRTGQATWEPRVHVIAGLKSTFWRKQESYQEQKRVFRNLKVEDVKWIDAGHWIHAQKPKQFIETLVQIVKT